MHEKKGWLYETGGIPDELFIRGKVPMTKEEIRSVSLSKLRLCTKDIVIDIGAGTGSMAIEIALKARKGKVFAIEQNNEAVELIHKNKEFFGVKNLEVIYGRAPDALENLPKIDKVFVGGTGGNIKTIFNWMDKALVSKGRVVLNFITIENLYQSMTELQSRSYEDMEVTQLSVSKGRKISNITMMQGQNPIYIISARKE